MYIVHILHFNSVHNNDTPLYVHVHVQYMYMCLSFIQGSYIMYFFPQKLIPVFRYSVLLCLFPPSLCLPPSLPLFSSLLFLPFLPPFLPPSLLPSLPSSPFLATKSAVLSTISDTESQEDNWSRVTVDTSLQTTAISMTTHNTLQPQYKYMYMYRHTVCMHMYHTCSYIVHVPALYSMCIYNVHVHEQSRA